MIIIAAVRSEPTTFQKWAQLLNRLWFCPSTKASPSRRRGGTFGWRDKRRSRGPTPVSYPNRDTVTGARPIAVCSLIHITLITQTANCKHWISKHPGLSSDGEHSVAHACVTTHRSYRQRRGAPQAAPELGGHSRTPVIWGTAAHKSPLYHLPGGLTEGKRPRYLKDTNQHLKGHTTAAVIPPSNLPH